jgi:O-antigen/teichoic acid export membrane protein
VSETRPRTTLAALAVSLAVTGATLLLNLLTGVLLARKLGPAGRGELTAVLLWPTLLATVGGLGVSDALTFHAARRSDVGELAGNALVLAAAQSLVLLVVGLVIEPLVLHRYGHDATVSAYILLAAFVPASLGALNLLGIVNGRQRLVSYQLLRGLLILLTAIALLAVAAAGALTIRAAVFCYAGATALTMVAGAVELGWRDRPRLRVSSGGARELCAYGLKSQTSNLSVLLNARLDQLLVSVFLAPRALGLYTIASTLGYVVAMVGYSAAPVALPVVAAQTADREARHRNARAMVSLTVAGSVALALPLIAFAPALIDAVFGRPFHGAATAARVLIASSVLFSVNRVLEALLKAAGRPTDAGLAEAIALAVTAASLAVLVPLGGLPGIASGSMLAGLTSGALLVARTRRAIGLSLRDMLPTRRDVAVARALILRRGAYSDGERYA